MEKLVKVPGPDHPITIGPAGRSVRVSWGGQVIARTERALVLKEARYPEVLYIPREDVEMGMLTRSEHATYCPYKGDCAYFSLPGGDGRGVNAVWTYEQPFPAVAAIGSYLAFYPDRVTIEA